MLFDFPSFSLLSFPLICIGYSQMETGSVICTTAMCQSVKRSLGASRAIGVTLSFLPVTSGQLKVGSRWAVPSANRGQWLLVHSFTVEELLLSIELCLLSRRVWCFHTVTLVISFNVWITPLSKPSEYKLYMF